jgi:hypothetical protein
MIVYLDIKGEDKKVYSECQQAFFGLKTLFIYSCIYFGWLVILVCFELRHIFNEFISYIYVTIVSDVLSERSYLKRKVAGLENEKKMGKE